MAEVLGFKGMRFSKKAGKIGGLCCPPYDIISDKQRKEYLKTNKHNVIRLELPREGKDPYKEAGKVLSKWIKKRILQQDNNSLYIYEEEFQIHGERLKIKGLIGRVKLEEFEKGIILPHENTLSKAKEDRLNLMKATGCNFSQIYSLYMDEGAVIRPQVDKMSESKPIVEFTDGAGVIHRLWQVTDEAAINAVTSGFADRKLYIADGHHRYETGLNYRNYLREQGLCRSESADGTGDDCDYIMMMLVEMENEGLKVLPTHRLVRGLENFSRENLLQTAEKWFEIQNLSGIDSIETELDKYYQEGRKAFALYTLGDNYDLLVLKDIAVMEEVMPDCSSALRGLDVSVLHALVLEQGLGIDKENMAAQKNLYYVKLFSEAIEEVKSGAAQAAFLLNPTRVSEIRDVAGAGEKMPQKSTYFYPKLTTGLVINKLNNK